MTKFVVGMSLVGIAVSFIPGHAALWSLAIFAGLGIMILAKANS